MCTLARLLAVASTAAALSTLRSTGPKKVAILGGSGYVGREVAKRFVTRGWEVASLSRRSQQASHSPPILTSGETPMRRGHCTSPLSPTMRHRPLRQPDDYA